MGTLLKITQEIQELDDLLARHGDGDGDDADLVAALSERFLQLRDDFKNKADAYAALDREIELRSDARKAEADRLMALVKADQNARHRLRDWLKQCMEQAGIKSIQTEHHRFTVAQNGGKPPLDVDDEAAIQDGRFVDYVPQVNRAAVRDAKERGEDVPYAVFRDRGTSLRIR